MFEDGQDSVKAVVNVRVIAQVDCKPAVLVPPESCVTVRKKHRHARLPMMSGGRRLKNSKPGGQRN